VHILGVLPILPKLKNRGVLLRAKKICSEDLAKFQKNSRSYHEFRFRPGKTQSCPTRETSCFDTLFIDLSNWYIYVFFGGSACSTQFWRILLSSSSSSACNHWCDRYIRPVHYTLRLRKAPKIVKCSDRQKDAQNKMFLACDNFVFFLGGIGNSW
jgi:hypothetical protein